MEIGQFTRIIEILVTSYCGLQLAIGLSVMRWKHKAAQLIFVFLVTIFNITLVWGVYCQKASMVEYFITSIFYFLIVYIFFNIEFWKLFAQNFLYWIQLMLIRNYTIYICCMLKHIKFDEYIYSDTPWHWFHILMMILTILVSNSLYSLKKEKSFLNFNNKLYYILFSIALIIEYLLFKKNLLSYSNIYNIPTYNYIMSIGFAFLVLVSTGIVFFIVRSNLNIRFQAIALKKNYEMLSTQYEIMEQIYSEKSRQIHDSIQQNILIHEALKQGELECAISYLEDNIQEKREQIVNTYTGIPVIDFMMNYKNDIAKKYNIEVVSIFDVYFCPLKPNDMCILLGNLFDNAIDAVKNMGVEERFIKIDMRTINNTFVLMIENNYCGKRKMIEGKYVTTKKDTMFHGMGLESVSNIVKRYNGFLDIKDDGKTFLVIVNIFENLLN